MRLTPPKAITFWIAVLLGFLGLLGKLMFVPVLSPMAFWVVLAGLVLLILAMIIKGL
jgi:hypothetical protein